jgi:hypothetical protein
VRRAPGRSKTGLSAISLLLSEREANTGARPLGVSHATSARTVEDLVGEAALRR